MLRIKIALAALLAVLFSTGSVRAQTGIEMISYELEVSLDFSRGGTEFPFLNKMTGRARLTFRNTGNIPITHVPLLLNRLMKINVLRDGAGNELSGQAQLIGIEGWESFQVNFEAVLLSNPLMPGRTGTLDIEYGGQLASSRETGMAYVQETLDPAFTIFRAETFAYPVINRPDATKGNPLSMGVAFNQKITVDMPEGLDAANGAMRMADEISGGRRRLTFETSRASAVMTFAVAPYESISVEGAQFFYFPEDRDGARRLSKAASATFDLFAKWFGPRSRSSEGLAFIEIPPDFGSQAVLPTIIQTAAAFRDPARTYEMIHEIAHLWNVRDLDMPSPRWNEGLSTFLQYLVDDNLREPGAYARGMKQVFANAKGRISSDTICASIREFGEKSVMRGQSYGLVGLFFARLYHRFGNRLIDAYGAFYQAYKEQGASSADFTAFLAEQLGPAATREIRVWFDSCDYLAVLRNAENFDDFLDGGASR